MKRFLVLLLVLSASAAYGEIYTWKDARGTEFYTNSLNDIPARYLKKARVLDVATGKKGGLAIAQPAPAAPGQNPTQQAPAPTAPPPAPVAAPTVANPVPPAAVIAPPQPQPRETRQQKRARRNLEREREE